MKGRGTTGPAFEFKTRIGPDGVVRVPPETLRKGDVRQGSQVTVRVTATRLLPALQERGVTDSEIERIAAVQLEPREQVVEFLLAEGKLAGRTRPVKRAKARG